MLADSFPYHQRLVEPIALAVELDEARFAVIEFIESYYNRRRPHSIIGYQIPAEVMGAFFERTKPTEEPALLAA